MESQLILPVAMLRMWQLKKATVKYLESKEAHTGGHAGIVVKTHADTHENVLDSASFMWS